MTVESIGIAVISHDYGRYLPQALRSVAAQTRPADHVVLVDDGSSDDTRQRMRTWQQRQAAEGGAPVTLIGHDHPRGPVTAFNKGLRALGTAALVKLDADDWLAPNYLERCLARLRADRADVVVPDLVRVLDSVTQAPTSIPQPLTAAHLARRNLVHASSAVTAERFAALDGFDEAFSALGWEDWDLWLRALRDGAVVVAEHDTMLWWRRHGHSRNRLRSLRWWRALRLLHDRHADVVAGPTAPELATRVLVDLRDAARSVLR